MWVPYEDLAFAISFCEACYCNTLFSIFRAVSDQLADLEQLPIRDNRRTRSASMDFKWPSASGACNILDGSVSADRRWDSDLFDSLVRKVIVNQMLPWNPDSHTSLRALASRISRQPDGILEF
jgi:hypothetical protein